MAHYPILRYNDDMDDFPKARWPPESKMAANWPKIVILMMFWLLKLANQAQYEQNIRHTCHTTK